MFCGYIADFPKVDSLLLNNVCLMVSTVAVAATPFCVTYEHYIIMSIFFGAAICKYYIPRRYLALSIDSILLKRDFATFLAGYISLTSIILVDLLGLDKLTNAFGLLILFRGAAAIVGSPLAGAVYDATKSYDIPFFMAATFFGISTVTSFMAPFLKR